LWSKVKNERKKSLNTSTQASNSYEGMKLLGLEGGKDEGRNKGRRTFVQAALIKWHYFEWKTSKGHTYSKGG